ncbi:MAG: cysteine desulfurase [Bacteroidales bacterium]|jgi:cysteine desulfurase/selenocysteine lyase|nr:cysteine desulfurase [Bacteroidales bacterium]MDD4214845.1 cysteine desulfurase [Bacteroidales bacterium]
MGEKADINYIRKQFPLLKKEIFGKPLIYFDNAATTQKPQRVIDALTDYYTNFNSNIHRGVHYLSQQATSAFEESRKAIQQFIHAKHTHEIIFTRGTTESINLVAASFSKKFLNAGDAVLITAMEHHSNIVPWQMACDEKQAKLHVLPIDEKGCLITDQLENLLDNNCKIVAVTHVSNTLGTINDIQHIIKTAHSRNIPVLIDGAQAISHLPVDVQELDCDFYCFSGHKMFAPMGVGVLYGKEKILEELPPYQGGGEMIKHVSFKKTTFNELPFKFEAGTPSVADVIGLKEAINFILDVGYENISAHENELLTHATQKFSGLEDMRFFGTAGHKTSVLSFLLSNIHPYDAGVILDKMGIAVRTGHHCTQPLMDFFGIPGTVRASFAVYNTKEEIDIMAEALLKIKVMFE